MHHSTALHCIQDIIAKLFSWMFGGTYKRVNSFASAEIIPCANISRQFTVLLSALSIHDYCGEWLMV